MGIRRLRRVGLRGQPHDGRVAAGRDGHRVHERPVRGAEGFSVAGQPLRGGAD